MKFWDIVRKVGSTALQIALPGTGSLIVGAINELLPDDKQLPETATGADAEAALSHIPADQRAALMDRKFDVTLEQLRQVGESNRAMLAAEGVSEHTTRPRIALGSFQVVAYAEIVAISIWAYAVITSENPLKSVTDGWAFIVAVTLPLVGLLNAYFGILKTEQRDRLDTSRGVPTQPGLMGIVAGLLKR